MESLKQLIHGRAYRDFCDFLDKEIGSVHNKMESARSYDDLLKMQGQIFALRRLKNLKEILGD